MDDELYEELEEELEEELDEELEIEDSVLSDSDSDSIPPEHAIDLKSILTLKRKRSGSGSSDVSDTKILKVLESSDNLTIKPTDVDSDYIVELEKEILRLKSEKEMICESLKQFLVKHFAN